MENAKLIRLPGVSGRFSAKCVKPFQGLSAGSPLQAYRVKSH